MIERRNLEDVEDFYTFEGRLELGDSVAKQIILNRDGIRELWVETDGSGIVVEGICYEFIRIARNGDLWWANLST